MDAKKNVCSIMFSEEEYSLIQQYKKEIEAVSDKVAILNAVSLALDNAAITCQSCDNAFDNVVDWKHYD